MAQHFDFLDLDPSLYPLDSTPEDLEFFKQQTGIDDKDELKNHVLAEQAEAYKVFPYPCIRMFSFLSGKAAKNRAYPSVLRLAKARQNAIYLELGCCFGADVHRLVADGWPVENVVATDLYAEYWRRGHNLFRTTPETFPATFVPGDIFSGELFDINAQAIEKPPLPLSSLTSLTPLKGHVSAIHASSFFHLFSEERQKILCRIVDALLSPEPGSIAFGNQLGAADGKENGSTEGSTGLGFRHSEASWKKMWVEAVGEGKFEVMARVVQLPDLKAREGLIRSNDSHVYWMMWAVKRV